MERLGNASEAENEASIEVAKAEENLDIPVGLGGMTTPFRNCLHTSGVHSKTFFIDEEPKVFKFRLEEIALLWIGVQSCPM